MWSPIKEDKLVGYAAHWDARAGVESMEPPFVRLLATDLRMDDYANFGFTCHYFFDNGTRTGDLPGATRNFGSRKGRFILCPAKDLVTVRKVVRTEEPAGVEVVSYEVDAPASVSIGCKEDKRCEGHWTFQVRA